MMRYFLSVLMFVILFNSGVFAQAEIARQQFEQGLINAKQSRYEEALKDFQNSLAKYKFASDSSDALAAKINYNIGVCFHRLGHAKESVAYFEAAIKLGKNRYKPAFYALGIAQSELGNRQAAKQSFIFAVRLDRHDGESWFGLAMIYLEENDLSSATACFQKAIQNRSTDAATAYNNLGVIMALADEWLKAEKHFETALAASGGKLVEARRNLALCRSQNFRPEAIAELEFIDKRNKEY